MRLQSEKKVTVKNKVFGGPTPLICLPLVAKDRSALLQQTAELVRLDPDLLEWRIDGYDQVEDIGACLEALQALKAAMGSIPRRCINLAQRNAEGPDRGGQSAHRDHVDGTGRRGDQGGRRVVWVGSNICHRTRGLCPGTNPDCRSQAGNVGIV